MLRVAQPRSRSDERFPELIGVRNPRAFTRRLSQSLNHPSNLIGHDRRKPGNGERRLTVGREPRAGARGQ